MSWLYLPGPASAYLRRAGSWGGKRFVMWSEHITRSRLSRLEFATACWTMRRSGTTSTPSTGNPGLDWWMLLQRASPANRSRLPEKCAEKTTPETVGPPPSASFARYDPGSRCWRTCQGSLLSPTSDVFSETWPKRVTMLKMVCYRRPPLERLTYAKGSGLLPTPKVSRGGYQVSHGKKMLTLEGLAQMEIQYPTPTANDVRQRFNTSRSPGAAARPNLAAMAQFDLWPTPTASDAKRKWAFRLENLSLSGAVEMLPTPRASDATGGAAYRKPPNREGGFGLKEIVRGGALNPEWVEWLMGVPIGWTALQPLAMDRFRQWLEGHGIY